MSNRESSSDGDRESERGAVKAFDYPVCPGAPLNPAWHGWVEAPETEGAAAAQSSARPSPPGGVAAIDFQKNEETRRPFEAGRERGREEGREVEREAQRAARKSDGERYQRQIAKLIADFAGERDRFLQGLEHEVVKLALAVAARILRREAQMDPLLLMGAVRVALGQVAGTSEVTLHVPAEQLELWAEAVALVPNLTLKPKVSPEEGMRLGDCVLESKVGTVDLGVRSQLGEIERGFFDRAAARAPLPGEAAAGDVAGG
jgi:flagellar assembly protein FliH